MIRVRLEVHSSTRQTLGYLDICNTGIGTEDLGHYALGLLDPELRLLRSGVLTDYPRHLGTWELVRQALGVLRTADERSPRWARTADQREAAHCPPQGVLEQGRETLGPAEAPDPGPTPR
jgi:hypothetical protein